MKIDIIIPKLIMDLQLFAETSENVETTEPQENTKEFVNEENFFTDSEDETPDWLKEEDEPEDSEETEEVEEPVEEEIKQNDKANTAFADMRRKVKQAEQRDSANDEWAKKNFGHLGVKDFDSYRSMMDSQLNEEAQQDLEEKGLNAEDIHKAMMLNPEYREMVEAKQPKQKQEQPLTDVETEKLMIDYANLQKEHKEITDPDSISIDVWDRYDKGYDLTEAYEIVNKDKLNKKVTKTNKAIARQETLNKINSKKHLKTEKNNGADATEAFISKETMANYRGMGLTEKQAIAFNKKFMK